MIFNETDFGQVADPEVKPTEAIDVDVNEEANLPDREHQRPQQHRRPPVRYGQDEYADTATVQDFVHHVASNECKVQEPKSHYKVSMPSNERLQQILNINHLGLGSLLNLLLTMK